MYTYIIKLSTIQLHYILVFTFTYSATHAAEHVVNTNYTAQGHNKCYHANHTLLLQSWRSEVLLRHKVQCPHWMQIKHRRLLLSQLDSSDANSPDVTLWTNFKQPAYSLLLQQKEYHLDSPLHHILLSSQLQQLLVPSSMEYQ